MDQPWCPTFPLKAVLVSADMTAVWYPFSQLTHSQLFDKGLLSITPNMKKKSHLILFLFWMLQWNLVGILVFYLFLTSLLIKVMCFCFLLTQQAYVSSGHQMAPPSPNTNSSSNSSGGGGEQLSKTNLYIRGLHPGTTDQDLVKLCQPWVRLNVFT